MAGNLASDDRQGNVGQWSCFVGPGGFLFWGTEPLWGLDLFTSPVNNPGLLTGGLLGYTHLRNQSVEFLRGFQTSCLHFIVLLCCVYGQTVPLNHILLIPAEHNLSLRPARCWKTCQNVLPLNSLTLPAAYMGVFWASSVCFLCLLHVLSHFSLTLSPSSFASFLPHFPSFTTCSLLILPLPFHLSIPIYYLSINNGPCCCCCQPDAAAAFVAALLSCILTHLLLPVL